MKISKEGYPFILIISLGIILSYIFFNLTIFLGLSLLLVLVCGFFRDPERKIQSSQNHILSPADGRIVQIEPAPILDHLSEPCTRIRIFLSIFDVHVNRSTSDGVVAWVKYIPGKFDFAFDERAYDKNEHNWIQLKSPNVNVLLKQIAGKVARRIVCYVQEGQEVRQGDKIGFIRFGSGMEIYIPNTFKIQISVGQKVFGGKTILAARS